MIEDHNKHHLFVEDKEIILVGTAHVSEESADLVARVIEEEKPETVAVELCQSRYQAMSDKNRWQETDLIKVIKEKKAFLL
ncbi:MAG: TraB domain-containing protein, partial [Deltaproteobacteria bacterium]|nr:TraB domain-containing protein [Deltaproteobacteria bacterium]